MGVSDIFYKCIEEWAKEEFDERINKAIDNFDEWIQGFDDEEDEIVGELMDRFCYYSKSKVISILRDLNEQAISKYRISNQDSLVSVVRKADGKGNSSYEYWLKHKELSGLSWDLYYDSLVDIDDTYWPNINKIVFVDDCSGTGTQFTDFLERVEQEFIDRKKKKTLKGKEIILLTVHVIEDALNNIQNYAQKKGLKIYVEYYWCDKKAFSNKKQQIIDRFIELSKRRKVKDIRGFKDAEALIAFYNNSPNDTLGIFWCNTKENMALFPRHKHPKAGWKHSNEQRKERLEQQYESKAR